MKGEARNGRPTGLFGNLCRSWWPIAGSRLAGFDHELAVEIEPDACADAPAQQVRSGRFTKAMSARVDGTDYRGIDLLAGGVPCPPFSIAGKRLGEDDERDLFPEALRLVEEAQPKAVMLENVRGLSTVKFQPYRKSIQDRLHELGYRSDWQVLNACEFGVPQLRPRFILVAAKPEYFERFEWPAAIGAPPNGRRSCSTRSWRATDGAAQQRGRSEPTASARRSSVAHASTAVRTSDRRVLARRGSSSASTVRGWRTRDRTESTPIRPHPAADARNGRCTPGFSARVAVLRAQDGRVPPDR